MLIGIKQSYSNTIYLIENFNKEEGYANNTEVSLCFQNATALKWLYRRLNVPLKVKDKLINNFVPMQIM
jgi:hypothetical protein